MEIKIVSNNKNSNKPQWLIWGGLGLAIFSFFATFIAQIIFPILVGVGLIMGIVGCIQVIINYLRQ